MRPVIFFVYLCFLLLKGLDYTYTGIWMGLGSATSHHVAHTHREKTIGNKEDESLINEDGDEEDDDESNEAAKKYRLHSWFDLTPFHTVVLHPRYGRFKYRLAYTGRLSYKYITQRSLRI